MLQKCSAPLLLLPENVRIRRFNLQTEAYHDFLQEQEHIMALDYDWNHDNTGLSMVYFTVAGKDSTPGAIKRAYIPTVDDGSNNIGAAVNLGLKYITRPDGIAVDWVGRNLYWADSRVKRLEVSMLDGRYRKHLVKTDLGHPSAIAVNPRLGMLYWADREHVAKIEHSWMDGQHRKVLVAEGLGWPTGLSIDYTNGDRLYWSDSKESRIESVLPTGEDRRTALYIDVQNPFSVSVFEDHIYWSTQEKGEVYRQDKFGRGTKTKLLTAGPWLTQISVYQQQRYNSIDMKSPCKGGCSHLCLLRPGGYSCACPQGTSFATGSNTQCDAGFDPPPTMPPPCQCLNGGICYFDDDKALCKCPPEWEGDYCQTDVFAAVVSSAGLAIGVTILIVALLGGLVYTARRKTSLLETLRKNMPSMPAMPSMPSMPSMPNLSIFRTGSLNASKPNDTDQIQCPVEVPTMSVSMVETGGTGFENPEYATDAKEPSAPTPPSGVATVVTIPDGVSEENIENPLYADEVQVVTESDESVPAPVNTINEQDGFTVTAVESPPFASDSSDEYTSSEPAAEESPQVSMETAFVPILEDSADTFINPMYMDPTPLPTDTTDLI